MEGLHGPAEAAVEPGEAHVVDPAHPFQELGVVGQERQSQHARHQGIDGMAMGAGFLRQVSRLREALPEGEAGHQASRFQGHVVIAGAVVPNECVHRPPFHGRLVVVALDGRGQPLQVDPALFVQCLANGPDQSAGQVLRLAITSPGQRRQAMEGFTHVVQIQQPLARMSVGASGQPVPCLEQLEEVGPQVGHDGIAGRLAQNLPGLRETVQGAPHVVDSVPEPLALIVGQFKARQVTVLDTAVPVGQMTLGGIQSAQKGVFPEANSFQQIDHLRPHPQGWGQLTTPRGKLTSPRWRPGLPSIPTVCTPHRRQTQGEDPAIDGLYRIQLWAGHARLK